VLRAARASWDCRAISFRREKTRRIPNSQRGNSARAKNVSLGLTAASDRAPTDGVPDGLGVYAGLGFKEAKREFERRFLLAKVEEHGGNISRTAEALGMERSHLHKKLKSFQEKRD